jgi:hypothetical protein
MSNDFSGFQNMAAGSDLYPIPFITMLKFGTLPQKVKKEIIPAISTEYL